METVRNVLSGILSKFHERKSAIRAGVDETKSKIISNFIESITEPGEIDPELLKHVKRSLSFTRVRFKTFNSSIGRSTGLSLVFTSLSFGAATLMVIFLEVIPRRYPEILIDILLYSVGLFAIVGLGFIIISDILLILYLGAVLRFGIQQARSNFVKVDESDIAEFECQTDNVIFWVYASNFSSFVRASTNFVLLCLIGSVVYLYPFVLKATTGLASAISADKIAETPFIPFVNNIAETVNALVPIQVLFFLSTEGMESLAVLVSISLVFSIFLNVKNIYQHAELSKVQWSEYDGFSAKYEIINCYTLVKVILHYLFNGELEASFSETRSAVTNATILLFLSVVSSIFYLYVIVNMSI
ncbi:hypothetical protein [Haloferax sp. Atlit-6N]|uniref:hypothetical protein n=1 Tax=Haloferax sp. Atlit-6N TaxID=2077205 RepID=UPI0011C01B39|nr:hypothetical protein [Haloferax sp. Atlit-6N]